MNSRYWDEESFFYGKQWTGSPVSEFDYRYTKDSLLENLEPLANDKILEIGCGLGQWTQIVGDKCRTITAVDISKEMIEKSKKNNGLRNVKFVVSDFLSFRTKEKFDKIFAIRSFEYLDSTEAGLNKAWKFMKPGGRLVIITKSKPCAWDLVYHERWKRSGFKQNKISFVKMRKLLNSSGFVDIKMCPVITRFPIFHGGNAEFPLIPNLAAKYAMALGRIINRVQPAMIFAESYVACAKKEG